KAKEHIQEMKKELDSLLQTAEKAFAVELLTMPAAVRKMKRKEVLGESTVHWHCAWGADSDLYFPCLTLTFLVKVTTIVEYEDSKHSSAKKITKKVSLFCFYSKNIRT
ncbi:BORE2 protein, partial [Oenanthe oenanthe]|nr:BORE2 protein [Oenanthe oenanthe]